MQVAWTNVVAGAAIAALSVYLFTHTEEHADDQQALIHFSDRFRRITAWDGRLGALFLGLVALAVLADGVRW